jgi:hypothetical protein
MNKKVLIWSLSIIGVSAIAYVVYTQIKQKKEQEQLENSIKELTEKYNVFNK